MSKDWIVRTTSLEKESASIQRIPESKKSEWQDFIKSMTQDDQLCLWQIDDKFDEKSYWGFCLTRSGKVVAFIYITNWPSTVH